MGGIRGSPLPSRGSRLPTRISTFKKNLAKFSMKNIFDLNIAFWYSILIDHQIKHFLKKYFTKRGGGDEIQN